MSRFLLWTFCLSLISLCIANSRSERPNVLFILTDDQDWHMNSLEHMPLLQKYLLNEGTLYSNHYCTIALCCPSRVNLWTGRAAHNTNVTDVWAPYGGYPKVVREGINDNYLPVWMQQAGYNTYYTGKLWNHHSIDNYDSPFVNGFNGSDFILDPSTYEYYNASMSRNHGPPVSYAGQYSPDVTAQKAYDFLDEALQHHEPFFLTVAPVAPHGNIRLYPFDSDMPRYADRHAHLFKDYKIPRTENFNPEVQGGVEWVAQLPRLNDTVIAYNDEYQRARLRALQSVDEMVEELVKKLDQSGVLDNTYIFYTTDNGYHISQHRMHPGKECSFDTDIHIPLIIRGPGIPAGHVSDVVTSHTDLSPTIMSIAGNSPAEFDGTAIPLDSREANTRQEHVNVEFWGVGIPEGQFGYNGSTGDYTNTNVYPNNTYKTLRLIGKEYSLSYTVWCSNAKELYDLKQDPGQMHNLLSETLTGSKAFDETTAALRDSLEIAGRGIDQVVPRLDALLMVLKSCKGESCVAPWQTIHPNGGIEKLGQALDPLYDTFYRQQHKVAFSACEFGYIKEVEGPQHVNQYYPNGWSSDEVPLQESTNRQTSFQYRGHWSLWV